jgi:high affinity Mn2+ porin
MRQKGGLVDPTLLWIRQTNRRDIDRLKRPAQLATLSKRSLVLVFWAVAAFGQALPALAQPPDAPSATKPDAATQDAAATASADPPADESTEAMFPHFKDTRFWLSGQANFIFQTHPPFYAAYSGKNSLSPDYEKATSRVMTLYTGVRLDNSTELLVDIEEAGGAALSTGLGLAGNTDLDIVRNPLLSKEPYLGRAMIHKVFALSKDKVENQRSFLSLFDELPRRRLELRFGKFSVPDFFDVNSVGSDTKFQFINWTTDNNGAYDYAADTRGYTVGATADYEDRNWGFRFAEALMPKVANGIDLVWKPWQAHAENFEYELRHGLIPKKSGVVRLLAYTNYANMGIYRQAIANFEEGLTPIPEITDHPWHITRKYGFGVNLEQNLLPNLTAFARFGWDNGKTESFAYTEVDQTFAEGLGANGAWWHRKQDRAGVAFVSNAIKKDHQTYLADGGYGFLLGDGALNYGRENILESYYTVHVWRGIYLAPGLQHIVDPGYNRDRGPVLVPSFRAHIEF